MNPISPRAASNADFNFDILPRKVKYVEGDPKDKVNFKIVTLTAEQKAEVAQTLAISAAATAASEKQLQEAQKSLKPESHEMYLPNISSLSLEDAQKSLGLAEIMMKNREDVGLNVHGRYGEQEISNLKSYTAAVKDYIQKYPPSEPLTSASSAQNVEQVVGQKQSPAVSIYQEMQGMVRQAPG